MKSMENLQMKSMENLQTKSMEYDEISKKTKRLFFKEHQSYRNRRLSQDMEQYKKYKTMEYLESGGDQVTKRLSFKESQCYRNRRAFSRLVKFKTMEYQELTKSSSFKEYQSFVAGQCIKNTRYEATGLLQNKEACIGKSWTG